MKNVFKFLGIVSIACTFLAASCGGGDVTTYKIKVKANPSKGGVVTGEGTYESGASIILKATPNAGYVFVNWEDDANAAATRTITVTGDATYTANFEEEAAQSNIHVTFGSTNWDAAYINALYSASQNTFLIAATSTTDPTVYPRADLGYTSEGTMAAGTYTGTPTVNIAESTAQRGNPYMWYYTPDDNMQLGGSACGDYWNKNLTLVITNFDATAMTISLNAQSTMGYLPECLEGVDFNNTSSEQMSMTVTNISLTAAKSPFRSVAAGKITRK